MEEIKITLTVDEVNKIINMLSQFAYKDVSELVYKLHSQGNDQIKETLKKTK